ncbi:MAG: homoserine kinase [Myxococcota bacterium]
MAVYTVIERSSLEQMLGIYDVEPLSHYEGIAAGSTNTSYRVRCGAQILYLRINEHKSFGDLLHERNLLQKLSRGASRFASVETPRILENCIRGHFFPLHGRWACLFPELQGREVATFELTPLHLFQVGAFLARAHGWLRRFRGGRANPNSLRAVSSWFPRLEREWSEKSVLPRFARALTFIRAHRRPLPRSVVHGDLFPNNTKWRGGELTAVFDWEMAGRDHMMLDLGICLNAWCYQRESQRFREDLVEGLLRGYTGVRALQPSERRGLYLESCFAALRFAVSRIRDLELPRPNALGKTSPHDEVSRDYLDYREYEARLDELLVLGRRGFRRWLPW